jgi:hypothetical protein
MTEAEIMKALECCFKKGLLCESCDECPNMAMGSMCMDNMIRDAIDLINRKNAEIEEKSNRLREILPIVAELKAEAIKEFAERLIEQKHECGCNFRKKPVYAVTADKIAQIAKEMGVEL